MTKSIIDAFDKSKVESVKKSQEEQDVVKTDSTSEQQEEVNKTPDNTDDNEKETVESTSKEAPKNTVEEGNDKPEVTVSEGTGTTEEKSTPAGDDAKPTTIKKQKDVDNPKGISEGMPISPKPFEQDSKVKDIHSTDSSDIKEIVSAMQKGNEATIAALAKSNADTISSFMTAISALIPKQVQDSTTPSATPKAATVEKSKVDDTPAGVEDTKPDVSVEEPDKDTKPEPNATAKATVQNDGDDSESGEKEIPKTVEHVDDDHDVYIGADGKVPDKEATKNKVENPAMFDDKKAVSKQDTDKPKSSPKEAQENAEESMAHLFIKARQNLANYTSEYQEQHKLGNMDQEEYQHARNTVYNLMDGATINNFTREELTKIANSKGIQ